MKTLRHILVRSSWVLLSLILFLAVVAISLYTYMEARLPSVHALKHIQLQVPLRIYSSDGKLIQEYGAELRTPVPLDQVPKQLIQAVLATEDQRYFEHEGVDWMGVVRAANAVIRSGRKVQGASTITMQVARNFFLSRKKTYWRKLNEILLALKINRDLSKEKVLELYLNKIYFGERAYGIATAAQIYYGKSLNQLTLPQMAMLAGLPQSPSRNNPISNPKGALDRRNHVLLRMYQVGYIDQATYQAAINTPLTARDHGPRITLQAPYVAEMVRTMMVQEFGKEAAYSQGFKVYTTLNSQLQKSANHALREGLLAYDERHGYRGPVSRLGAPTNSTVTPWLSLLQHTATINGLQPAIVLADQAQSVTIMLKNGQLATISWSGLKWAQREIDGKYLGAIPTQASDIVQPGDLIWAEHLNKTWSLAQVPQVQGALISLDPNTGAILALVGGFDFSLSHFNRVTQAERQPGSGFKPFVYSAALEKGYTLASTVNDAPIVQRGYGEDELWRPHNDTYSFQGPTRLRVALTKSINLVSIRLLQQIGIDYAVNYVQRFGFDPNSLPHSLSLAIGSATVTPLQMATGYAVFANGGYKVTPYFINSIVNGRGETIYSAQPATVSSSDNTNSGTPSAGVAPRVITAQNAYLITSALKSVITQGTGRRALVLHRNDIAGKTGTTNNKVDAWFNGYTPKIVTTVWVGFDDPKSLHEFGAQAALPIWIAYMKQALQTIPEYNLPQPEGMVTVRIDPTTGLLAYPGQPNAIYEYFREQYAPTRYAKGTGTTNTSTPNNSPSSSNATTSEESDEGPLF